MKDNDHTAESFARSIHEVLKAQYPDWAAALDYQDVSRWVAQWWPVPTEALLSVREWARAYHDDHASRRALPAPVTKK